MSNNLSKHTLGLTQLQSGRGTPSHQAPLGSLYIDVLTANYYKNTDGLSSWSIFVTTGTTGGSGVDTFVTGFTYSNNNLTILQNQGQSPLSVSINTMSGLTINGNLSTTSISPVDYIDFNTGSTVSNKSGRLFYDAISESLAYNSSVNPNVNIKVGQQLYTRVVNNTGSLIPKGSAVTIQTASNNIPEISLAIASAPGIGNQVAGLVFEDIPNGSKGLILNQGLLSGVTVSHPVGSILYLSDTVSGGTISSTSSLSYNSRTNQIGYTVASGTTNGIIYVNINNEDINLSLTDIQRNILEGNVISTGAFSYTGLTKISSTQFSVAPLQGWVVNNTYESATNPTVILVDYSGTTTTTPYLNSADQTYVLVTSASTLTLQTTFPTPQERRQNIFLGNILHPNRVEIQNVNNTVDFDVSPMSALRDLWSPLKLINQGVIISANGANLSINSSSGTLWGNGIGWVANQLNPNSTSISSQSPVTFQYRTQLGPVTGGTAPYTGNTTFIDPNHYDLNGVVTPIGGGSNSSTNQRVYLFPTGLIRIQYGQQVYSSLAAAVVGSQTEQFVEYSNNRDAGILIGIISVQKSVTTLNNSANAVFNFVSKFGEILGGTGGLSTTTLQQAYDNSSNPEIITNSTQDGVQFRGGTGIDTDKNIIVENNAGTQTAWITAEGGSFFKSIDFNTTASTTTQFGRINWDSGTGTLNIGVGDATTGLIDFQVGQEEVVRVYNEEATTLQKGEIVYVYSSQGNRPSVKRALATGDGYSVTTLGMVAGNISSLSQGYVTTFGIISNLNTLGLTGGTPIWLSPTIPGGYTEIKPQAPNHTVLIGYVVRVSATVGSIFVNISNGWELDELHDVRISGATEGDLLIRSSYSGSPVWVNSKTLIGDYIIDGNLTITSGSTINTLTANTINVTSLGTSGNCVTDIFVDNLYGCSPITIHDSIQSVGSSATGVTSFAFGNAVQAYGNFSHAEGGNTQTTGNYSHAEGESTTSQGNYSHAEGRNTVALGSHSHTEGNVTQSVGDYSHAEGGSTQAIGTYSHTEGTSTFSFGTASHSEGIGTSTGTNTAYEATVNSGLVILDGSYGDVSAYFSNGNDLFLYDAFQDNVYGRAIFVISAVTFNSPSTEIQLEDVSVTTTLARVGDLGYLLNNGSFGGPGNRIIPADFSHTEGQNTVTLNDISHTEGYQSLGLGLYSHAEGDHTMAIGNSSHSEGEYTKSIGNYSHSQGGYTKSIGQYSFASGYGSVSSGDTSFVHSTNSVVMGNRSVVLGGQNITGYTDDTVYVPNLNVQDTLNVNSGITTNNINLNYIDFDTTQTGTTSSPGRLFWDVNNRTLSLGMIGGPVQQIGEEQYYLVENQTTGTLNDGTVVRAVGTSGSSGKILIDLMIANGTIPAFTTMGVLTQPLNSGDTGYVTSFGLVRGIDTTGTPYGEVWSNGTILYVSPTILGGFTNVKPITPNQDIIIAIVMDAGPNGSVFVRPDVYRPFKDPNRIIVAKQNGDFTSIKDAVDSITTSSSSNRYVIDVGPGQFYENEIDLTAKPYVSIVGSNIQTTVIIPNTPNQNILSIGANNEISFLSFSGAGSGYAAINCDDIGDFGQAHKCSFYDCDINVWVKSSSIDTKFYGEYLDFNGTYSYGTKVEASNNVLALANLENYYNFPTGSNTTYCSWVSGSGATLNVFGGDNISNGFSGTTAFYIQDGAELNASTVTSDGCDYGIHNPNIGLPCRFDVDNASIVNSALWDLFVNNLYTFGTFGGSSSHQKVYSKSPDVYWLFLDIDDGELDITRKASVTFADGTHTDFTTLVFEGSAMGLMDGGTITTVSGFTVNTASGFGYLAKTLTPNVIMRIDWVNSQITLGPNENKYIYINENSILSSSATKPSSINNIILGRVITNSTGISFIDLSPVHSDHTSNRFGSLFREAMGPIYASGSIVTEGNPFRLNVTSGEYYYASNEIQPVGGTGITFTQYYRSGSGVTWITTATTVVTNSHYDGNGVLSALTAGYYTKHTLYLVGEGGYENYFLVLGQNEYSTLVQTENALLPTPPTFFSDSVTQVANIYVQQGATGITQVEDIRPTIAFRAGGVNASSVHGNLLGLTADDHTQYLLVNGGRAMSGNLDMGGNQITNVGNVDGVDISSHAARHKFGGLDAVGTVTPTANAIPYADVNGKLDSWISTATTSTFGLVKTSTSDTTVVGTNDTRLLKSVTGGTFSNNILTLTKVDGSSVNVTGFTTSSVTGFTYSNNLLTLSQNQGQSDLSVSINTMTGLTINGSLSANSITITTTPTNNNTNTQILTRNSTTGNVEYRDSSSLGGGSIDTGKVIALTQIMYF